MISTVPLKAAVPLLAAGLLLGTGPLAVKGGTVRRGDVLPIYVQLEALAEAETPGVDPAGSGGAFWIPGPERVHGWALRDLRDYLQKMTGAKHPLTAAAPRAEAGIVAGTFAQFPDFEPRGPGAREAFSSGDPEAFLVEVQGDRLFILGRTNLGLMAGVYTFLDRLGCKWYAPGAAWEDVPERDGLVFGETLNAASAGPSYQARHFFSTWGPNTSAARPQDRRRDYVLWGLRNRMGGGAYAANQHNDEIIPRGLFETRPELFALVTKGPWAAHAKNNRLPREIARGKPEVVELAVRGAVAYFEANAGKGSYYHSFSLETGDGIPACEESLARVGNHTPTDLNFWFANQVAAGIEEAGPEDRWVGMLSYSDHSLIPSFDLHPKVSVTVTTGLADPSLTVEQRLDGFRSRKARRLGVYDYLNLMTWSKDRPGWSPASKPREVAANLKRWHDHGARTYMAETSDSWVCGGPGHYLAARLLWDIRADPGEELDAYYRGAFGPAAAEVRMLFEDWGKAPRLGRGKLAQWHHWITTAEQRVGDKAVYRARLGDLKRYFLYLNLVREFEIDLEHPGVPSKQERYVRLLRYVGSQRGEGAFHALGLFFVLLQYDPASLASLPPIDLWGDEFKALAVYNHDEEAWAGFPPATAAEIDRLFAAARLPLDNVPAASPAVLDPVVRVFPASAEPPAELHFPKLHGPPGIARQYLLKVTAPTPKLTLEVVAGNPLGGGVEERTCVVTDPNDNEIQRVRFRVNEPVRVELGDVKPGLYTATFAEFGAEQLTVRGGNTIGAVRSARDFWGFNPFRATDKDEVRAYFLVPAGAGRIKAGLSSGRVSIGLVDGAVIAAELAGDPKLKKVPAEFTFAASDRPRIAYVRWKAQDNTPTSEGFVVEGVTAYSPDPASVLYESLE